MESFPERFVGAAEKWGLQDTPLAGGFMYGDAPEALVGQADAALFIRSVHGLARNGALEEVAAEMHAVVKPGGVLGVVQHRAKADADADWADGSHGYMREADVIAAFEAAGFAFEAKSEINANPDDAADDDAGPWRLPPTLRADDEAQKEANRAIGESDRMTLRFRKPAA